MSAHSPVSRFQDLNALASIAAVMGYEIVDIASFLDELVSVPILFFSLQSYNSSFLFAFNALRCELKHYIMKLFLHYPESLRSLGLYAVTLVRVT